MMEVTMTMAIKIARKYFDDIYLNEEINNLVLEEIVCDNDSNEWRITFGYDADADADKAAEKTSRVYKVFHIDGDEGDFKGMFMREMGK